jgi:hypothetical protein
LFGHNFGSANIGDFFSCSRNSPKFTPQNQKNMKKILFGGLMMTILATSCKKDEPAGPAPGSYLTNTAGTTWNFRYTDLADPTNNEDYTITATGRDTSAYGKTYAIYQSSSTSGSLYQTAVGSDYYKIGNLLNIKYESKYMVDNAATGSSWETPISSNFNTGGAGQASLTARVRTTIISKGGNMTINGKNYSDVINTKIEIQNASVSISIGNFPLNLPINFTTQEVNEYYSPKYGLIKSTTRIVAGITLPGGLTPPAGLPTEFDINTTDELMSSSIQ